MSLEKAIQLFAGFMVILSVVLTLTVSPMFIWFTAFIGFNLAQSAVTGFCPAAIVMRKFLNLKTEKEMATPSES